MLDGEMSTWLSGEMTIALRALQVRTTVGVSRADMRAIVLPTVSLFDERGWKEHLVSKKCVWVGTPRDAVKSRRRGPSTLQVELYEAIRAKSSKRVRVGVFSRSTRRRTGF